MNSTLVAQNLQGNSDFLSTPDRIWLDVCSDYHASGGGEDRGVSPTSIVGFTCHKRFKNKRLELIQKGSAVPRRLGGHSWGLNGAGKGRRLTFVGSASA